MKVFMRSLGIVCILISLLFLFYGSIKQSRVTDAERVTTTIDGIEVEVESASKDLATCSYTIGTAALIGGVFLLFVSGRMHKDKYKYQ